MPSCAAVELALPNLLSSTFPGLGFAWIIGCERRTRSQGQSYSHDPAPMSINVNNVNKKLQKIANQQHSKHSKFQLFTKSVYVAERPKSSFWLPPAQTPPTWSHHMHVTHLFLHFALATLLSLPSELHRWRPTRVLKEFLLSTLPIGPYCSADVWAFAQV